MHALKTGIREARAIFESVVRLISKTLELLRKMTLMTMIDAANPRMTHPMSARMQLRCFRPSKREELAGTFRSNIFLLPPDSRYAAA